MRHVAPLKAHAYKRRGSFEESGLMTLGTWLFTKMRGELVGTDAQGNRYYQDRRLIPGRRRKRWVIYNGVVEASRVPADWHGWLHYTTDSPPPAGGLPRKPWQKEHEWNLTGTGLAYRPPGSSLSTSGEKPKPAYEAWRPG
ncbi:NADH:ubiquinone oxidoreductase subunit [Enhydrobacter aerosaccus]|uniref:NADH:ubiquinone oxidoreductase subunit n=2 Tax=Enhydrobacter aerosaccus TaxID=225324 RepID=A0A1T4LQZ1_9HYPH|nr:NADH:ubiquinone oxidoreductase subunit [Enhydrobacter aerosaccus]